MVKIIKSEVIPKPRYPLRSGVLKNSLNVKVERGPGRLPQYAWQKEADKALADAKKLKRGEAEQEAHRVDRAGSL